mmetsp:Transcript_7439/g.27257  ORF Transcript_7439/g.27257 Transcript_7439/m.27257 type:complete len:227 (+) Transcript_7439:674-1354(+)
MGRGFVWIALAPQEVVHLHVAVVGRIQNEGVLACPCLFQSCQQFPNLLVNEADACRICPPREIQLVVVGLAAPAVGQGTARASGEVRVPTILRNGRLCCRRLGRVQQPLGWVVRAMRPVEGHLEEEGLAGGSEPSQCILGQAASPCCRMNVLLVCVGGSPPSVPIQATGFQGVMAWLLVLEPIVVAIEVRLLQACAEPVVNLVLLKASSPRLRLVPTVVVLSDHNR